MSELNSESGGVITEVVMLRYDYSLGKVAGKFMARLKQGKILATSSSKSELSYLLPPAYCERSFDLGYNWVKSAFEGLIEASILIIRSCQGKRTPLVAITYIKLDKIDSVIGNYVYGLDLSDLDAAQKRITTGNRVKVKFEPTGKGRATDFSSVCTN